MQYAGEAAVKGTAARPPMRRAIGAARGSGRCYAPPAGAALGRLNEHALEAA